MRKKILTAILIVFVLGILGLTLAGCTQETSVTKYEIVDDYAVLKKFKGTSNQKEFIVLDEFEGKPVTKIDKFALANAEYLEKITIGKNVSEIDQYAFSSSTVLQEFAVAEGNTNFQALGGVLYNADLTTLVSYPNLCKYTPSETVPDPNNANKTITKYKFHTMPDTVTTIKALAFYKCLALYEITLSPALKSIGDLSFLKCYNLESFTLPDGLESIGTDGISYLSGIKDLFVPKSVKTIGNYAFFGITKIPAVRFEHSEEEYKAIEFGGKKWRPLYPSGFKKIPLAFGQTREVAV